MTGPASDEQRAWEVLGQVTDPEIPVITLVEMKVIRSVMVRNGEASVVISPTYVACPAVEHMKEEIRRRLLDAGFSSVHIEMTFSPPWSTDMLEESVKEKLRAFGIAPPPGNAGGLAHTLAQPVPCPYCRSEQTRMESSFGSALCRQIFYCDNCRQSFERFKPL
jgi:ring-1,2-phenylacetyl-CoA epoxidase subunit PaaD